MTEATRRYLPEGPITCNTILDTADEYREDFESTNGKIVMDIGAGRRWQNNVTSFGHVQFVRGEAHGYLQGYQDAMKALIKAGPEGVENLLQQYLEQEK